MAITASKSFSSALKSPFLGGAIAVPAPGKAGSARDASPNSPFRGTAPAPLLMEPSARSPALPGPAAGRTIPAQGWGPLRTNLSLLHLPTRCCRTEGACPLLVLVFKLRNTFHFSFVSPFWLLRVSFVPPPPPGRCREWCGRAEAPVCQCVRPSLLHCLPPSPLPSCSLALPAPDRATTRQVRLGRGERRAGAVPEPRRSPVAALRRRPRLLWGSSGRAGGRGGHGGAGRAASSQPRCRCWTPGSEMPPSAGLRSSGGSESATGGRRCGLLCTPALPSVLLLSCLFMASVGWVVGLFVVLFFSRQEERFVWLKRPNGAVVVARHRVSRRKRALMNREGKERARGVQSLLLAPF